MDILLVIIGMFVLLAGGVWIGLSLVGVSALAMVLFTDRPITNLMINAIWESGASFSLTALPLFIWMGEILFRSKLSAALFTGLAPWFAAVPGRLLHTNVVGCTIFAAISGSSAATCATIGKITIPELRQRGYPEGMIVGSLAGAGTLGLLIPPSIIMIVYGVAADVSIGKLFVAGVIPGLLLAAMFSGYIALWSLRYRDAIPTAASVPSLREKIYASRHLLPTVGLIGLVLGSIYTGIATATESAALGTLGALVLSALQRTLTWPTFRDSLLSATRLTCMIGLILGGAAFLSLGIGLTGIPRDLAAWVDSLNLSFGMLIFVLALVFIVLGCFLDGISMVVLTIAVLLPLIQKAGIDPVWFGIFIVLVVEMAQITPPVGFNLFVLQGITGHNIVTLAWHALPFFFVMVALVTLVTLVPEIVLWLPTRMIGQ
ncbi:MAG: TRAP transporter large permease subunit [Alphaproteobacteria bacterium]|nr:TRAP transporter large permease subunit [Alphaproteobacteria bacterium]